MKKLFTAQLLLLLFFSSLFFFWPDKKLHLVFCDVGQGDAILLQKGFSQVLIDGGPDEKVLECLSNNMPFWDKEIELVINTHGEKDHLAGLVAVIERYRVNRVITHSLASESEVFREFHQLVLEKTIPVFSPKKGDEVKIGDLSFQVLWPEEKMGDLSLWEKRLASRDDGGASQVLAGSEIDLNETSIVLHLQYDKFDALLTGDISSQTESRLEPLSGIEVLKIAHHGSKYSTSQGFLEKIKPGLAIISVGKNSWGHPTGEVLENLRSIKAKILRTDQDGEVEIITNGQTWQVFKD